MPDTTNGNGAQQVEVYAVKGPLAGRRVILPSDQVEAATAENGWAVKIEPGAQLLPDPGAAYDTSWVIPGYSKSDLEPFAKTAEQRGGAGKPTDTAKATDKAPAEETSGSSSASKTSSSQPAAPSATEPDAASPSGGGSTPSGSKTKTSSK